MPYKHNESCQHKFKKAKYRVTNWREYNDALRKRGDITVYVTDDAIAQWNPAKVIGQRGRPQKYSAYAIECCLMIRQVFKLPLRQTEGFMRSVFHMLGLHLSIPDYTCMSKRSIGLKLKRILDIIEAGACFIVDSTGLKVYGKDEWHQEKHKVKARRSWRKLHLAVDENHQIIACDLTEKSVGDTSVISNLFSQVGKFRCFIADGAYDSDTLYQQIIHKQPNADIVIPPPKNAVVNENSHDIRNRHVDVIKERGRVAWQKETGYGFRAGAELAMLRYKTIIGPKMKSRNLLQQKTEASISVRLLNIMTGLGMPVSVKIA